MGHQMRVGSFLLLLLAISFEPSYLRPQLLYVAPLWLLIDTEIDDIE